MASGPPAATGPKKYKDLKPPPPNVIPTNPKYGVDLKYIPVDEDGATEVGTKTNDCFIAAKAKFDEIFYDTSLKLAPTKSFKYKKGTKTSLKGLINTSETYTPEDLKDKTIVETINDNLILLNNLISQGIINLQVINLLGVVEPASTAGGGNKNKKNRNQDGGSVPDLINNVAAFQNMGSLLTAGATPYDNAVAPNYAMYNAGSFNAGINMPVSSSAGLPVPYKMSFDQKVQTGGKSKKSNKSNKNN